MARWPRGTAEVEALLDSGELHKLTGAAANGERLMRKASTTVQTARSAIETDPDSAFVLAYDAARQALTALLAHQGLRPTTSGGHYVVEQAIKAQFGPGFRRFGALRRRRNELEYRSVQAMTRARTKPREPSRTHKRSSRQRRVFLIDSASSEIPAEVRPDTS